MKNRIICILLATIMIFTFSMGAIAEGKEIESATIHLSVNEMALSDLMGWNNEGINETARAIASLANRLQVKYVKDEADTEIEFSLDGAAIAGAAFLVKNENIQVVSDIFPKYVLEVPALNVYEGIDTEELLRPVKEMYEEILQKAGEPENVTEYILGNTFTSRKRVKMSTDELFERAIEAGKQVMKSTQFKALVENLKKANVMVEIPDPETLTTETLKEEKLPQTEVYIYSDDAGNQIVQVDILKDGDLFDINIGTINEKQFFEVEGLESYYFYAELSPNHLSVTADMDTNAMNTYISTKLSVEFSEDKRNMKASAVVSVNDREFIDATLDYVKGVGAKSGKYTVEGRENIKLEELQDPSNEAYAGFMVNLMTGLTDILKELVERVPEMEPVLQTLFPQN